MTTIPLNDSTRAILAQVRAAAQTAAAADEATNVLFKRDWPAMSAASDAWRARNPNRHISASDKDPEVQAAGAEYHRAYEAALALDKILRDLASKLAAEVAALVKARAQEIGAYRLPIFTYQKRPTGFRYLLDGVKQRDSKRGQAYTALHAVLVATVTEDGIADVAWQHTDEYSATPNRLRAKCLKFAPWVHGGASASRGTPAIRVHCASTVLLAQGEAQA
jgi:hypothetical protein